MNIAAPAFLRKVEPKMTTPVRQDVPINDRTAQIMDDIVRTAQERDELQAECNRLRAIGSEDKRQIAFLERKLAEVEAKRDYYQVHSVALHTRLCDIASDMEHLVKRIDKALAESQVDAAAGKAEPSTQSRLPDHELTDLAAKLAPEQPNA